MTGDLTKPIDRVDADELDDLETLIRSDYEHCHPGEMLADLKHRARFSKEASGLLRDWMRVAEHRAAAGRRVRARQVKAPLVAAA